jgi:hypothetical protein
MRIKTLLTFCLFIFLLQAVSGQQVAEVQQTLITKKTGTWCPYCGGWGWDFFESLIDQNSEKAVLLAAHFGGSTLENGTSLEWMANLGSFGQPRFFLNNEMLTVSESTANNGLSAAKAQVDQNALQSPVANVGLLTSWDGDDLLIQTRTRFFKDAEGEYFLGIYLVEDGVIAAQSGQTGQVPHHYVLRGAATATTFGDLIVNGAVSAGAEFTSSYATSVNGFVLDKLDIVGVIWKKENDKYQVVNVWSIDAKPTVASVSNLEGIAGLRAKLQPNPSVDEASLTLELESPELLNILVLDAQGKAVLSVFRGVLPGGSHQLPVDVQSLPQAGWYALLIQAERGPVGVLPLIRL